MRTSILPKEPPAHRLVFIAEGARQGSRSRVYAAYENRGEVHADRTAELRSYDLHPSPVLATLRNRLVVDWGKGVVRFANGGAFVARLPVVEIADPTVVPFPGYGGVLLTFDELCLVVRSQRPVAEVTPLNRISSGRC